MHHRRSIRLKGFDYSQAGAYFITICCQDRTSLFGTIQNGGMQLNDAGKMVEKWYHELENKFHDMRCGEMVVMPNHMHFIIINVGAGVGTDGHAGSPVHAGVGTDGHAVVGTDVEADPRVCPNNIQGEPVLGEYVGSPQRGSPVYAVVQWFKTMTTNAYIRGVTSYNWQRFNKRVWQRNYYEHIIRNENDYSRIAQYIIDNPKKWVMTH